MPDNNLPPGFVLDQPGQGISTATTSSLPSGFVLDQPGTTSSTTPGTGLPAGFQLDSPASGSGLPTRTSDPSSPWYKKAWDWANTPLLNLNSDNRSGFVGGTEDVLSGLTSPLSIALTAATFGGGAALRGLGLAAEELPVAITGAKTLLGAGITDATTPAAEAALRAAGIAERELPAAVRGADSLFKAGVTADNAPMLDQVVRNSPYLLKGLAEKGITEKSMSPVLRGAKSLIDAGFTGQAVWQMTKEFPQFLDALKEERYDDAARLATHVVATGAGAYLGQRQLREDIAPFTEDLQAKTGLKIRLSDTNKQILDIEGKRSGEAQVWQDLAKRYKKDFDEKYKTLTPVERAGVFNLVQAGMDKDLLTDRWNYLTAAAGQPEESIATAAQPPVQGPSRFPGQNPNIYNAEKAAKWQEHARLQTLKTSYSPEDLKFTLDSYKAAMNPTPEMEAYAGEVKNTFDALFQHAQRNLLVRAAIENYITQIWAKEDLDNPAANVLRDESNSNKFMTDVSMARHRVFESAFEGQLLGRKLLTADPSTLIANYVTKMGEAISNRNFLDRILDLKASDGRPLAALSGTGKVIYDSDGKPAMLLNGQGLRNVIMSDMEIARLKSTGMFDKFLDQEVISKIGEGDKEHYVWNTHGYRSLDTAALEDWNYGTRIKSPQRDLGTPDSVNAMVKGEYMVHPEAYEYLKKLFNVDESMFRRSAPLKKMLDYSTEAKHLMLSFSPFHIVQEGLRGLMTGINPFNWEHVDINTHPDLLRLVEQGLVRGKDRLGLGDFESALAEGQGGRSKVINKVGEYGDKLGIPGKPLSWLRDFQNGMTDFLFERYIPGLKDRGAMALYERWMNKLSNDQEFFSKLQKDHEEFKGMSTENAAARLAAQEANERFGGLNYRQLGRAVGTQDFLRLATLAPDWLESEIRSLKRAFDPTEGYVLRRDAAKLMAGLWGVSRVMNMLLNGKMHMEAPFGVAHTGPDGKEKIYSVRTLPTDVFHAISDPVEFMRGRLSPGVRALSEGYSGRDFQGRKLTPFDTAVDIVRNNFVPIPGQALFKGVTGGSPDLTTPDQGIKALGFTAHVFRTEAQKKALELSSNKNETGPVDENQLAKHRAIIDLENKIRSGQVPHPVDALNELVEGGHLSHKDAKAITKNVQETQGMDAEMAGLYTRASRLPMTDFLKVWDAATPHEQSVLLKLLLKKRTNYLNRDVKEMSPAQRAGDTAYQRLKSMFPGAPVF